MAISYVTADSLDGAQSGSAPIYAARAWVNFNGTGTVAIRASGNVSSITDNGTGDYTVNFTTAMPDANFSVAGWARCSGALGTLTGVSDSSLTTTSARVGTMGITFSVTDAILVTVNIFR
jgi:hypothetical protein